MKIRAVALFLFAAVSLLCCSSGQPALLILDPASERYFAWQGMTAEKLRQVASRSGYRLDTLLLVQDKPYAEQIDSFLKRSLPKDTPVLLPALLGREAAAMRERLPQYRIKVIDAAANLSGPAMTELGRLCGQFAQRQKDRRIVFIQGREEDWRSEGMRQFREAFLGAGANEIQLEVQALPAAPDDEAIRTVAGQLRAKVPALTVLYAGAINQRLMGQLPDWEGHFVAEGIAGQLPGLPLAAGSLDPDWDVAMDQALGATAALPSGCRFTVNTDYLNK